MPIRGVFGRRKRPRVDGLGTLLSALGLWTGAIWVFGLKKALLGVVFGALAVIVFGWAHTKPLSAERLRGPVRKWKKEKA